MENSGPVHELAGARRPAGPQTAADWVVLALGTGLFVGCIPLGTATIATAWGIPLAMGIHWLAGWHGYLAVVAVLFLAGIPICRRSAELLGSEDPKAVTFDEISTLPLVYFLSPDWHWRTILAGFALHRLFDILKPLGIRRMERLGGGLGIMADDLLASVYAWVALQVLLKAGALG